MAGTPPRRYKPGELQRTREHLGELTPEEARRMAKRLGGQVGVERSADKVESGYRKLSDLNRRRVDRFVPQEKAPSRDAAPGGSPATPGETAGAKPQRAGSVAARPGYFDLVRMSFAAARAEHQLKTFPHAATSLFAIFGRIEDVTNPEFLRNSDKLIFAPIETLVLAVRHLLARNAKVEAYQLRLPYFQQILSIVRDWDIEGISRELARLQRDPHGVTFADCRQLCVMIFRPLVILGDLDPTYHVAMAIKQLHDLNLLALPKQSPDADRVKLQYAAARDSLVPVFRRLRERCYPLLMRLASVRYSPYPEFFRVQRETILAFLSLTSEEIIPGKDLTNVMHAAPAASPPIVEPTPPSEQPEEKLEAKPFPALVVRGLEFLDQLFPQAGFARLASYPDLYPYFQPLFNLPRGVELIPPEDPLQQVIILIAVLQQLFYGFRAIRFRAFDDDRGNKVAVNERIEALTANWHLFLDEVIGKNYANSLDEVCRQLERNRDFLATDYGDKLETDLQWAKRHFLLPLLSIRAAKGMRTHFASNLPGLPDTVRDLKETIGLIIDDVESKRLQSIENPFDDFSFAIEDFLSKRIRLVLSRRVNPEQYLGKRVSNLNLIVHAGLVLAVLEYLTTSPDSFYYAAETRSLYRTEVGRPGVPQYNVPVENPYEIIAAAERARRSGEAKSQNSGGSPSPTVAPPVGKEPTEGTGGEPPSQPGGVAVEKRDPVTGMALLNELTSRVRELIATDPSGEHPFVLLALSLRHFSELSKEYGAAYAEAALRATGEIIASEIRLYVDIPHRVGASGFVLLLPETRSEEAAHLARRLGERFHATVVGPDPMAVSIGIVEHLRGWSLDRLLKLTEGAIRGAAKRPSPSIVIFQPATESFVPLA